MRLNVVNLVRGLTGSDARRNEGELICFGRAAADLWRRENQLERPRGRGDLGRLQEERAERRRRHSMPTEIDGSRGALNWK
jgi:hypothetical protein